MARPGAGSSATDALNQQSLDAARGGSALAAPTPAAQ